MIHYFKASNFSSFQDEISLDFRTSPAKGRGESFIKSEVLEDVRLSKVIAIFGPNASGKTNVLRVLSFVSWFITESFLKKIDASMPYTRYLGNKKGSKTKIEVVFELQKTLYKYIVELIDSKWISYEQLSELNKDTNQFNQLYKRNKGNKDDSYEINDSGLSVEASKDAVNRDNASILSIASQFGHQKSNAIVSYWALIAAATNVDAEFGHKDGTRSLSSPMKIAEELYKDAALKKMLVDVFNKMDVGLSDITIEEYNYKKPTSDGRSTEDTKVYFPSFKRESKSGSVSFEVPIYWESMGVMSLYSHLTTILQKLRSSTPSIVILDEIDSGIHPELIPQFLNIFRDSETNPHGHQLLVTLHSNQVMDCLEKNQIYFTEINELKTELYPLESIKNVRKDVSFSSAYRAGRFGALPQVD